MPVRAGTGEQHDELCWVDVERPGRVPVQAVGHDREPRDGGEPVARAAHQLDEPADQVGTVVL